MTDASTPIEQLWYTWSTTGIDDLKSGYRIRAASAGLRNLYSQRVQRLERYERYWLPGDADTADLTQGRPPVCLALINAEKENTEKERILVHTEKENTKKERILVHKVYLEADGIGRPRSFFIHLLAGLPDEFSAMDAIALWNAPPGFWQVSDIPKEQHGTELPYVPLEFLKQIGREPPGIAKVAAYLPYVIQTYLTKKRLVQKGQPQGVPQKLYIAAPDESVILLISGLIRCLPGQLVKDLTFSTFEHDVTEATTEIVGTCWLSGLEQDPRVANLLPPAYYTEKLAINCYTMEQRSPLENNQLLENRPLVAQFAQDATKFLMLRAKALEKSLTEAEYTYVKDFEEFLADAQDSPDLDVNKFLNLYEDSILEAQKPLPKQKTESILLISRTLSGAYAPSEKVPESTYKYSAKLLSKRRYQEALIDLVLSEPDWWDAYGRNAIISLYKVSKQVPALARPLHQLAQYALTRAVAIVKRSNPSTGVLTGREGMAVEEANFNCILDLMFHTALPNEISDVWISLLKELVKIKHVLTFFSRHWDVYFYLLRVWSTVLCPTPKKPTLEHTALIRPLLFATWAKFGEFLTLGLPLDWNEIVTKVLVFQSKALPTEGILYDLEHNYGVLIEELLLQLARRPAEELLEQVTQRPIGELAEPVAQHSLEELLEQVTQRPLEELLLPLARNPRWETAGALFDRLAAYNYGKKLRLLFILLDSPMGKYIETVARLLQVARLAPNEKAPFLERYGPQYLILSTKTLRIVLKIFEELVKSNNSQEKMRVLLSWFSSPSLSAWFDSPPLGQNNLKTVLSAAGLNPEESSEFFRNYGKKYISLYPHESALLYLFDLLARSGSTEKMQMLSVWLELNLDVTLLEQVLRAAHLTEDEKVMFYERFGEHYSSLYPRSLVLRQYKQEYQEYRQAFGLDGSAEPAKERDLSAPRQPFPQSLPPAQPVQQWNPPPEWYSLMEFTGNPSVTKEAQRKVNESTYKLLKISSIPEEASKKLLQDLAVSFAACIQDELALMSVINSMSTVLTSEELARMLFVMAGSVNLQRPPSKDLLLSYVHCLLSLVTVFYIPIIATEDERYVQPLLDALLQGADGETFAWLNAEAQKNAEAHKWAPETYAAWQKYNLQRHNRKRPTSPFQGITALPGRITAYLKRPIGPKDKEK